MFRVCKNILVILSCACFFSAGLGSVWADSGRGGQRSTYLKSSTDLGKLIKRLNSRLPSYDQIGKDRRVSIPTVRFQIKLRGVRARLILTDRWIPSSQLDDLEDNNIIHLTGDYRERSGKSRPVALTLTNKNGALRASLSFNWKTPHSGRKILTDFRLKRTKSRGQDKTTYRINRVPSSAFPDLECGSDDELHSLADTSGSSLFSGPTLNVQVVELFTIADDDLSAQYPTTANDLIAQLVNSANVLYATGLGIAYDLKGQHAFNAATDPDPYSDTTNSPALLQDVTFGYNPAEQFGEADLFHLFSGRDFDGSNVGVAWLGVVCNNAVNLGITQFLDNNALGSLVFAHEAGHNFGANHDPLGVNGYVMSPVLTTSEIDTFSSNSQQQIASYLSNVSCLDSGTVTLPEDGEEAPPPEVVPTPAPAPVSSGTSTEDALAELNAVLAWLKEYKQKKKFKALTSQEIQARLDQLKAVLDSWYLDVDEITLKQENKYFSVIARANQLGQTPKKPKKKKQLRKSLFGFRKAL